MTATLCRKLPLIHESFVVCRACIRIQRSTADRQGSYPILASSLNNATAYIAVFLVSSGLLVRIASAHCTASQTGWIALHQSVLHVKPSSAEDWSLIGGTGPRAPVAARTLDYWGQGSEQVRSVALKLQHCAVPIGFLHKLHCQVEVMRDKSDLALAHAASISLARIYSVGLCCVRKRLKDTA